MLYLKLFHGRTDANQEMDEWGSDGPVFGPYEFLHTTYTSFVRCGNQGGDCDSLYVHEDMVYYDGVYYGDWSVFGLEILRKGKYKPTVFEQEKANLPT